MGEAVATCTDVHDDARKGYCRGIKSASDDFGAGIVSFGSNAVANAVSSRLPERWRLGEVEVSWVVDENADEERC